MHKRALLFALCLFTAADVPAAPVNPLFAMDTGTRDAGHADYSAQAALVKKLGFAGYGGTGFGDAAELVKALDANGVPLVSLYLDAKVDSAGFHYDRDGLEAALPLLKGRGVTLWLPIGSATWKNSDPAGDSRAVEMIREMAGIAEQSGSRIALYPHTGMWMERAADALRVAEAVDLPGVGVTFNLCHHLKVDGFTDPVPQLQRAATRLFMVTISGADPGSDWDRLIQPLDRGSYDLGGFVQALADIGYGGPVGLQGYGIPGPVEANLKGSMTAWRALAPRPSGRIPLTAFDAFRPPIGEWDLAGAVGLDKGHSDRLAWSAGAAAAVNGPNGKTAHLVTKDEYGDVEIHIEFMMAEKSNSGVYLQGRYEIQLLDSWGVEHPKYGDCGGVYQRWHEEPGMAESERGYGGVAPRVNASRKPGVWQSYDIVFRAPRFDAQDRKTANARFVRVVHNGIVVHEDVEVGGPTRAAMFSDEKPRGPLMLQGDHGPVAFRNICIRPVAQP